MKFLGTINYFMVEKMGLTEKTKIEHWLILDYFQSVFADNKEIKKIENEYYTWISTKRIIQELPLLKLERKRLYKLIRELEELEFIKIYKDRANNYYFAPGKRYFEYFFTEGNPNKEEDFNTKASPKKSQPSPEMGQGSPETGQGSPEMGQGAECSEIKENLAILKENCQLDDEDFNDLKRKKEKEAKRKKENINNNNIYNNINNNNINNIKRKKENYNKRKKEKEILEENGKKEYAERVFLSENEFEKLVENYGQKLTNLFLDKISNYKTSTNRKYLSDYRAILNWVVDEILKKYFNITKYAFDLRRETIKKEMKESGYSEDKIKKCLIEELEQEYNIF